MRALTVTAFLLLGLPPLVRADTPSFIKVGSVYSFSVTGQMEPIVASVLKDEGAGWLKVSTVQKREEFWLNLGHVVIATAANYQPDSLKAATDRKQVLSNLRAVAAAADTYRLHESKEPTTDALFKSNWLLPKPVTVAGEDYRSVDVSGDQPLTVKLRDGTEVSYPRR